MTGINEVSVDAEEHDELENEEEEYRKTGLNTGKQADGACWKT